MKNSFGNNISITLFGESHGEAIGAVLDGIPAGIKIDYDFIDYRLSLRRPFGSISTTRSEKDNYKFVSGIKNGFTTGTPICVVIENEDVNDDDYNSIELKPRPSHSDYSIFCKHGEYGLLPGGGHSSGRITAPIVIMGAIAQKILESTGVLIGSHIKSIADIRDTDFTDYKTDIEKLNNTKFAVLDSNIAHEMTKKINDAKHSNDSVGGVIETAVLNLEAGVGEPWFDTVEGVLSHALFSIPGIKGVEFGLGFDITKQLGSNVNDQFYFDGKLVKTKTNNSGGILGGISNGQPILFRVAVKPTPTISKQQDTVDLKNNENTVISATGRHDPCIVHRARAVVDSVTALVILDLLTEKYGVEGLKNGIRNNRE